MGASRFEPWEEVCLAAEQHDVGMAAWDRAPTLNPQTGLPRSFMELSSTTTWRSGGARRRSSLPQSRYAALLVSMHGTALYERRDRASRRRARARVPRRAGRAAGAPARDLRADPRTAPFAADEIVRRNQQLVWRWDSLSLGLLLEWAQLGLDPWPFRDDRVSLRCEGRRLAGRFDDEEAMRAALDAAPWVTLELELAR